MQCNVREPAVGGPLIQWPFDHWLRGGLVAKFGPVLNEPLPSDLVAMVWESGSDQDEDAG